LGLFGDPVPTANPTGDDLVERKPTELVPHPSYRLNSEDANVLNNFLKQPSTSQHTVEEIQQLIASSGARAMVESDIQRLLDETSQALDHLPVMAPVKAGLSESVSQLLERTS